MRNNTAVGETSKAFETLSDVGVDFIKTVILCNDGGDDNDKDIEHLESPDHMRRGRVAAFEAREVSARSVDGNMGVRRQHRSAQQYGRNAQQRQTVGQ